MKKLKIFALTLILILSAGRIFAQPVEKADLGTALEDFSRLSNSEKDLVLGGMGLPSGGINWSSLAANLFFSSIGFIAFVYGKKSGSYKAMGLGFVMMVYPYMVSNTIAMIGIGVALCFSLYYFRD